MTPLSDDERDHILLIEEYRAIVKEELRHQNEPKFSFWCEKLVFPALLVVMTAIASGLIVPSILRERDDRRRNVALKSELVTAMVADSATVQMALIRYNEQMCDYWAAMARIAHSRRMASMSRSPEERRKREAAADEALKKEYELNALADQQIGAARMSFGVALDRMTSLLHLYYGNVRELETFDTTVRAEQASINRLLDYTHQDELRAIFEKAASEFGSCRTAKCDDVLVAAESEIDKIRASAPSFGRWREATRTLAAYILAHEPLVPSDVVRKE